MLNKSKWQHKTHIARKHVIGIKNKQELTACTKLTQDPEHNSMAGLSILYTKNMFNIPTSPNMTDYEKIMQCTQKF